MAEYPDAAEARKIILPRVTGRRKVGEHRARPVADFASPARNRACKRARRLHATAQRTGWPNGQRSSEPLWQCASPVQSRLVSTVRA
jgi:hypothetical protein